jgi:hypothetical protein
MILNVNSYYFLKQHYQLIFVMVTDCVLFEVRTKFVNNVTNSQVLYSRWKFTTLTVQYTTLDYSSQLF